MPLLYVAGRSVIRHATSRAALLPHLPLSCLSVLVGHREDRTGQRSCRLRLILHLGKLPAVTILVSFGEKQYWHLRVWIGTSEASIT